MTYFIVVAFSITSSTELKDKAYQEIVKMAAEKKQVIGLVNKAPTLLINAPENYKEKKVTIFLVEQNAKKALELADRAYVLVNGKVTIKGTGQELLKNQDIQAAYLEGGA